LYSAVAYTSGAARIPVSYQVIKRSAPSLTFFRTTVGGTAGQWDFYNTSWIDATTTSLSDNNNTAFIVEINKTSGFTANNAYLANGDWTSSAEL
jgi:hypothetical protein